MLNGGGDAVPDSFRQMGRERTPRRRNIRNVKTKKAFNPNFRPFTGVLFWKKFKFKKTDLNFQSFATSDTEDIWTSP